MGMASDENMHGLCDSKNTAQDLSIAASCSSLAPTTSALQVVLDQVRDAVITVDAAGSILTLNAAGQSLFDLTATAANGQPLDKLLPQLTAHEALPAALARLAAQSTPPALPVFEIVARSASGKEFTAEILVGAARMAADTIYVACLREVAPPIRTEAALPVSESQYRQLAERELSDERAKVQVTLHSIGDAVITTDAVCRIEYINPAGEELIGWTAAEACGKELSEVIAVYDEDHRTVAETCVLRCLTERRVITVAGQLVLRNRYGREILIQHSAAPIRDRNNSVIGAVLVCHDVSKEQRLHRALLYQVSHDTLTGLINRRTFERRLSEAVARVRASASAGVTHALLYLDLDQFKLVNDTCGHGAGDRLLTEVTELLRNRVRASDLIARLGGDEFAILLEDCTTGKAAQIADNLRQAIRELRFVWQGRPVSIGVSIGIVAVSATSENGAEVLSAADVACYAAKDAGRDRVHLYGHNGASTRHREMQCASRLTQACDENRLELYYQPIVPIGHCADPRRHYELLVRLRDERGALVQPAEFIPAAERYNLMSTIDRWVVTQALEQWAHCVGDVGPCYTLAINLSGTSLNDERFLTYLGDLLQQQDLSPGAVCFEITETAAIGNLARAIEFMTELRARGCLFALDDFGSGLSSFMYLKNLPVDFLKIDGQFVQRVHSDRVDRTIVEAATQIGRALGVKTIAERVEVPEVLDCLGDLGVQFAQGFYIARPAPVALLGRELA
jgi:diguanylate cyclase (GGDEF)-like protein/PAS domain S-box-containing protein